MRQVFFLCLGVVAAAAALRAQYAELSGVVKDPSGAAIPNARLQLRDQDTGVRRRSRTNQYGFYSFTSLKPGAYDVTVQADGFVTLTRNAVTLGLGDRAALDFSLELGTVATTITAAAGADLMHNSMDGAVGTLVGPEFVSDLPLNGRSFQSLIEVTPGVVITRSYQDSPGQFSVNGQRTDTNYFIVDGVSANFGSTPGVNLGQTISGASPGLNILGGTNSLVSVDAMQEFQIQTSTYSPEFGRTPGAQISILTRSGTNQFHGTVYDYLRNDLFDARNWFNTVPQPKPPLRQNDFGGTLGGPIRKNRAFFFASYEGLRLRQPGTEVGDFLTAAARAKVPAVYQPFVNAFPLPSGPVNPDGITAPLTVSYSDPSHFDATSLRFDHVPNDRLTWFARYNHSPSAQGQHNFSELDQYTANVDTATGGFTLILSPTSVNVTHVNWSRLADKVEDTMQSIFGAVAPPTSAIFPFFSNAADSEAGFSMPFTSGAFSEGLRADNVQRQINVTDDFSMVTGLHQLRFGIDYRRMSPTNAILNYGYAGSVSDYPTLLAGGVNILGIQGSDPITVRLANYSLFGQDTWKVTTWLVLTYGLRWEINTPPASVTSGEPLYSVTGVFDTRPIGLAATPLWHTGFHNIAPRIGAAARLTPTMSLRGGFGVFYDLGYGSAIPLAFDFPYWRSVNTVYTPAIPFDLNSIPFQPLPFTTEIPPGVSLSAIDPNLSLPATWQWNLAFERQLGVSQTLTATYVGAWGMHLLRQDLVVPPGSILATQAGVADVTYNGGYSHYRALQLRFQRRMARGFQALASYTLSSSTDTGSTDVGLGAAASYTQSLAGSVSGLTLPKLAPSDFDARHTASAAVSWQSPSSWAHAYGLFRGWALDGIFRANSARPLNVLYAQQYSGGYYLVEPDIVPGQPFWIPDANQPMGRVLNPNAFAIPAATSGDFPRNSLRGFPFSQTDLALRRRFALTERLKLDARVEYFNVFNHPNFGDPFNLWGYGNTPDPLFGKVLPGNMLNNALGGGAGALSGGQAAIYAPGGPRSAQFTLKLSF